MLAPERRELILQEVVLKKSALVKELCVQFGVTGETIRKDLSILEQEGKLFKTYGGAYVQEGVNNEIHARLRQTIYTDAKTSIGKACAKLVKNGDTIILDESTTCRCIAQELLGFKQITVLTNSMQVVDTLAEAENIRIVLLGGRLRHKNLSFVGNDTTQMLQHYYADKAFVSCRGLDMQSGITDGSEEGGFVRRLMLTRAAVRYLVVDAMKLAHTHYYRIGGLELVDTIVIDTLPPAWRNYLEENNVKFLQTIP